MVFMLISSNIYIYNQQEKVVLGNNYYYVLYVILFLVDTFLNLKTLKLLTRTEKMVIIIFDCISFLAIIIFSKYLC